MEKLWLLVILIMMTCVLSGCGNESFSSGLLRQPETDFQNITVNGTLDWGDEKLPTKLLQNYRCPADGFDLFYDSNFDGTPNNDYLVFRKCDGNDYWADGGFAWQSKNTSVSNNVTLMMLDGDGTLHLLNYTNCSLTTDINGEVLCGVPANGSGTTNNYYNITNVTNYNITNVTNTTANYYNLGGWRNDSTRTYPTKQPYINRTAYIQTPIMNFEWHDDFTLYVAARGELWTCALLGTAGTAVVSTGDTNHIGVITFLDSTTANSGFMCRTDPAIMYFSGGEAFRVRWKPNTNRNNTIMIMGFGDATTAADPTDGCYLKCLSGVSGNTFRCTGYCKNNAGPTGTGTTYDLTAGTWYAVIGQMNSGATSFNFTIYDDAGTSLWSSSVGANIPNAAGREFGWRIYSYESTTGAAAVMTYWDSMEVWVNRELTRGLEIQ